MSNEEKLKKIEVEIRNCKICKIGTTGLPVSGEGSSEAKIMFVGEAPGKTESKTGRPFVGRSGKLLRSKIKETGLLETEVFITSPVKYLPLRGTPSTAQIKHGKTHFDKQVEVINPKIMVLLGATAVFAVLNEKLPILKFRGQVIERHGKKYFITLHPAAVLRFSGKYKKNFEGDFKKIKKIIN